MGVLNASFRANGGGFYPYSSVPDAQIQVVPISSIEPPKLIEGVPTLRKYKLVPLLLAFTHRSALSRPCRSGSPQGQANTAIVCAMAITAFMHPSLRVTTSCPSFWSGQVRSN